MISLLLGHMEYDKAHSEVFNTIIHLLQEKMNGLVAVIAFGSFGTQYERQDSDIDLGILTKDSNEWKDPVKLWNLAQEIAHQVARDVELIHLRETSTVFAFQILSSGTVIYCSNDLIFSHFDNLIMSMYLQLQEERKDILADYEKGIYFG